MDDGWVSSSIKILISYVHFAIKMAKS